MFSFHNQILNYFIIKNILLLKIKKPPKRMLNGKKKANNILIWHMYACTCGTKVQLGWDLTLFIYLKSKCLFRKLKRILTKSMEKTKCITEIDKRGTLTHSIKCVYTHDLINLCGKELLKRTICFNHINFESKIKSHNS